MRNIFVWLTIAGILCINIGVRLLNPDKTETRLFLDFWWLWLLEIVAIAFILFVAWWTDERRR